MPPTHVLIWEITHTCSLLLKRSATKYSLHSDNVIDEQTKRVAVFFLLIVANMQIKSAKMHKSAPSQRSVSRWLNKLRYFCRMHSFTSLPYSVCSWCDSMSSFFNAPLDCWVNCVGRFIIQFASDALNFTIMQRQQRKRKRWIFSLCICSTFFFM